MHPVQIFVSYRRDDTAGYARAIADSLAREWGADAVFIDVDDIGVGQAFPDAIAHAVGESEVLLVLIGPRWLGSSPGRASRLDDKNDFVRREIEAALARQMRIVPVLLDGASMPSPEQLPPSLQALSTRNAMAVSPTRFATDLALLIGSLRPQIKPRAPDGPRPGRRTWIVMGSLAMLGVAGAAMFLLLRAAPRAEINGIWQAEVTYDWPGARYIERFAFDGQAASLTGTASFLQSARPVLEGRVEAKSIRFVTRTEVVLGEARTTSEHRYHGEWQNGSAGEEIHFVMQTEGAPDAHAPVHFIARRTSAPLP